MCIRDRYKEEAKLLDQLYPYFESYLSAAGRAVVEAQGTSVQGLGELETPLIDGKECAYTFFEEDGTASCGIEKAYIDGKIDWKKPISCHLYPIRVAKYNDFEALNYDRWSICSTACSLGEELKVPVYQFLKEPLIRKYGSDFYGQIENVARDLAPK